jgi:hypothetical protein
MFVLFLFVPDFFLIYPAIELLIFYVLEIY